MIKLAAAATIAMLNWSDIPMKVTVATGTKGYTVKFKTTNSQTYKGYFSAVATSSTGHLTRRLWFSETPNGEPLQQFVKQGSSRIVNACDVRGVEIKLAWSQEPNPKYATQCKLKLNTEYYLNHMQYSFGDGAEPTKTSAMIRGASTSGTP